jgi:hypothetical protein
MIAERFGAFGRGFGELRSQTIREKIETEPKIRK